MNRQEKQAVINAIRTSFSDSPASFLVGVQGLSVNATGSFRKKIRSQGGDVSVVKNTLLRIAVDGVEGVQDLKPHFQQQIAVVFAAKEPTAVARIIYDTAKEHESLKILAGYFDGKVIDSAKVQYIATLPSREQLLGQLCGIMKAVAQQLVFVLKQASEKQQGEQAPAQAAESVDA